MSPPSRSNGIAENEGSIFRFEKGLSWSRYSLRQKQSRPIKTRLRTVVGGTTSQPLTGTVKTADGPQLIHADDRFEWLKTEICVPVPSHCD